MSHVVAIAAEIRSLAALKAAAEEMGAVWHEGKTSYNWFGRHVGDYPLPPGFKASDLGKCSHAISLPGVNYQIGVVARGDTFTLLFDFYNEGNGSRHDGSRLKKHFGDGLTGLTDLYQHHAIKRSLKAGQRAYKIDSAESARKLSKFVGQEIGYSGNLKTVVVSA